MQIHMRHQMLFGREVKGQQSQGGSRDRDEARASVSARLFVIVLDFDIQAWWGEGRVPAYTTTTYCIHTVAQAATVLTCIS